MTPADDLPWRPRPGSRALARAIAFFVAPAHEAPPAPDPRSEDRAAAPPCLRAAVLGRRADVTSAAAGVAGELRAQAGARAAAVLLWEPAPAPAAAVQSPAIPAARALGRRLAAEGLEAEARGWLVRVRLPGAPRQAAAAAVRAGDLLGGAPAVLAVAGPRASELEALLAEQDLIVLVTAPGEDPALLALAERNLASVPAPVVSVTPLGGAARALAAAGFGRAPALRALRVP